MKKPQSGDRFWHRDGKRWSRVYDIHSELAEDNFCIRTFTDDRYIIRWNEERDRWEEINAQK
jgi:hypothetical protein